MIEKDKKVKFHYVLTVDDKVLEDSKKGEPLEYVHGSPSIIIGLQKGLEGRKEGESLSVTVKPEEGYGVKNKDAIINVKKEQIPPEALEVGKILSTQGQNNQPMQGTITAINEDSVTLDFNHPLADKTLIFDVDIVSVS